MHTSSLKALEKLLKEKRGTAREPFSNLEIYRFLRYYELVLKWNTRLHLTTLIDPLQFFQRHLEESIFAESVLLPEVTHVWDLGSGLGIPGVPLAILRPEIIVNLVEAKFNKTMFLEEVVNLLSIRNVGIYHARIESLADLFPGNCIIARAVENMEEMIPVMMQIGKACSQILFFGSKSLEGKIKPAVLPDAQVSTYHIPTTNNQYLFSLTRST